MKFAHIGDLHLGKWICQQSMLPYQEEVLFELLEKLKEEDVDHLIIAGDVYDRLVPPTDAIDLFDRFITQAIKDYHLTILMISGNHDSSDRLHFASSLLQKEGLHIATKDWHVYEKDGVVFHLLPFIKPIQVELEDGTRAKTYQEAIKQLITSHPLEKDKQHVLITHQFVAGKQAVIESESETILSVGGSELVDVHLFDDYDYVALGHLHAPQSISREVVRYSGSLLRYSFDEVKQNKSFVVVEIKDQVKLDFFTLHPSRTLKKYKGYFDDFIKGSGIEEKDHFIAFELLDDQLIVNAMDRLRQVYPNALQLTYEALQTNEDSKTSMANIQLLKKEDTQLFMQFYQNIREKDLDEQQMEIVRTLLIKAGEKNET